MLLSILQSNCALFREVRGRSSHLKRSDINLAITFQRILVSETADSTDESESRNRLFTYKDIEANRLVRESHLGNKCLICEILLRPFCSWSSINIDVGHELQSKRNGRD